MRLYAHISHNYDDRARRHFYVFAKDSCTDVPDDVGRLLLEHHPSRFCDVTDDSDPYHHDCSYYDHTMMEEPPLDRMHKPRRQKVSNG